MRETILPFAAEHVASAAALLAARHRHDRTWVPDLSAEYEDPAVALPVLHELLAADGTNGVVALKEARVIAYLLGAPELGSPTQPFAGFAHPRGAAIAYAGHAADPNAGVTLYPRLYATLAEHWVAQGLLGHNISVPATPDTMETWWDLGFSRFIALGVRSTTAPNDGGARSASNLEIRRATPADEGVVQDLVTELFRTFASPPIFVPFLPETAAERQRFVAERLADPACPCWLAVASDRLVGLQLFEEPQSVHWHQSPLQSPPRAVYLFLACTAPEARNAGVGAVLLDRTMAWAREAGYDSCMAHFLTASRAAAFWRGRGFQPVSYWLKRTIDERATWACGEP